MHEEEERNEKYFCEEDQKILGITVSENEIVILLSRPLFF
jgi:hypothetical protein